jgi:hypothetical protein
VIDLGAGETKEFSIGELALGSFYCPFFRRLLIRRMSMVLSNLISTLPLDSMGEMLDVDGGMKLYVANRVDSPCMVQ